ncbi:hypothetical protein O181_099497 [Austropuccinia psidii MF-1]|uniref:Uncharacterized protein n=1 Tax=Austropuccinia psidii MF-1 TaxID=1389203 RepID=A0A9Q3JCD8_9BASI|nr:hypothetical protein [Austropuccinia psidii MF-1]
MEGTTQSNQMDMSKEEARPSPEVASLPQERQICRMPEFPPIPQGLHPHFDANSESGLIHDNISRDEPFLSGRNRDFSMPIQELVQSSQRGGVGNMPKPSAEGHELLLTHRELSKR